MAYFSLLAFPFSVLLLVFHYYTSPFTSHLVNAEFFIPQEEAPLQLDIAALAFPLIVLLLIFHHYTSPFTPLLINAEFFAINY